MDYPDAKNPFNIDLCNDFVAGALAEAATAQALAKQGLAGPKETRGTEFFVKPKGSLTPDCHPDAELGFNSIRAEPLKPEFVVTLHCASCGETIRSIRLRHNGNPGEWLLLDRPAE